MDTNIVWHHATVTRERRNQQNNHKSMVLWFTGLSGSGKSTLAHAVEEQLHRIGCRTFVLDGDKVRHGLNGDLGFSSEDRKENLRRVGEMSKLFIESGTIILTAFISPFRKERRQVRSMMPHGDFIEIYVNCPIEVCEKRDVKGLYRRARTGEVKEFTGISSPYEIPQSADLTVNTDLQTLEESVENIIDLLKEKGVF